MTHARGVPSTTVRARERPLVLAHRGGCAIGPENTVLAFTRGLAAGADGFECDVRLAADRVPVVIHDATLDRTTDVTGAVHGRTSTELARIDATCRFAPRAPRDVVTMVEGVPRLDVVLERFSEARVIVELKDEDLRLSDAVVDVIRHTRAAARVCVASFHHAVIARVRALAPELTTSASRREVQRTLVLARLGWPFSTARPYRAFQVPETGARLRVVTPAFVRRVHREGAVLHVWTVNAPADVERLLAMGVDGIISDRPDMAVEVRDAVWGQTPV